MWILVVDMPGHIYVMGFKPDGTAKEAMEQVNAKGYAREHASDRRKPYKIGINFLSWTGTISDWLAE